MMQAIQGRLQAIDDSLSEHSRYRIVRNTVVEFNRRQASRKAAAITYFAMFSIFSFVLLLIALLSFALSSKDAQAWVMSALSDFLPSGTTGAQGIIQGVVNARGVAAGFGLVLLLWGALGWFESIDQSINEMWAVEGTRPFIKGKLFALAMISGIALVMLLSWLADIAVSVVRSLADSTGLTLLPGSAALWNVAVWAVSVGLMFVMFLLLYRFSPMCGLSWGEVWRGALITAVIWSVVRSAFAIYVTRFANFSSAYGPIGAVIAFLTWLYIAHMIILFGAGLVYATRLEEHGIHESTGLRCALPQGDTSDRGQPEPHRDREAA